jgi:hypothetical protein
MTQPPLAPFLRRCSPRHTPEKSIQTTHMHQFVSLLIVTSLMCASTVQSTCLATLTTTVTRPCSSSSFVTVTSTALLIKVKHVTTPRAETDFVTHTQLTFPPPPTPTYSDIATLVTTLHLLETKTVDIDSIVAVKTTLFQTVTSAGVAQANATCLLASKSSLAKTTVWYGSITTSLATTTQTLTSTHVTTMIVTTECPARTPLVGPRVQRGGKFVEWSKRQCATLSCPNDPSCTWCVENCCARLPTDPAFSWMACKDCRKTGCCDFVHVTKIVTMSCGKPTGKVVAVTVSRTSTVTSFVLSGTRRNTITLTLTAPVAPPWTMLESVATTFVTPTFTFVHTYALTNGVLTTETTRTDGSPQTLTQTLNSLSYWTLFETITRVNHVTARETVKSTIVVLRPVTKKTTQTDLTTVRTTRVVKQTVTKTATVKGSKTKVFSTKVTTIVSTMVQKSPIVRTVTLSACPTSTITGSTIFTVRTTMTKFAMKSVATASVVTVCRLPPTATCQAPTPHPVSGDCSKYIDCSTGLPVEKSCPARMWFNVSAGQCEEATSCHCLDVDLPTSDCTTFAACRHGMEHLIPCPFATVFDKTTRTCVNPIFNGPGNCTLCDVYPQSPPEASCFCKNRGQGSWAVPGDCNKYYACQYGSPAIDAMVPCPDFHVFHEPIHSCGVPSVDLPGNCTICQAFPRNPPTPECFCYQKPVGNYVHPDCRAYYQCAVDPPGPTPPPSKVVYCPDGMYFEPVALQCEVGTCATPTTTTSTVSVISTATATVSVDCAKPASSSCYCSQKPTGNWPYPTDCNKYYGCRVGTPPIDQLLACSPNAIFQANTQKCTGSATGSPRNCSACLGEYPATAACLCGTSPAGTYPYPGDCSLYYSCKVGVPPTVAKCPLGKIYSTYSKRCDDPSMVPPCIP